MTKRNLSRAFFASLPLHSTPNLRNSSVEPQTKSVPSSASQPIVILDFGAQYSQLIARRIREQNVFSVVLPCTAAVEEILSYSPVGVIISGGPSSVYDADAPPADPRVLQLGLPVLGICYGLQFMVHALGGKVRAAAKREYGHADVDVTKGSRLFEGLPSKLSVWMSHGDEATELPAGFHLVASSPSAVAAIEAPERKMWRFSSIPKYDTPSRARISCATSLSKSAAPSPHGL